MYYCDMGKEHVSIQVSYLPSAGHKTVSQYVLVDSEYLHKGLEYRAHTIVQKNIHTGQFAWYKHRGRPNLALLTKEEQDNLVFQILQSETW